MDAAADREWMQLVHRYAICTREFSEAVASLGWQRNVGPEAERLWEEVKKLHDACMPVAEEIDRRIGNGRDFGYTG